MKDKVNVLNVKLEEHLMLLHVTVTVTHARRDNINQTMEQLPALTVYLDVTFRNEKKQNVLIAKLEEHLMLLHVTVSVLSVLLDVTNLLQVQLPALTVYLDVINPMMVHSTALIAKKIPMLVKQNKLNAKCVLLARLLLVQKVLCVPPPITPPVPSRCLGTFGQNAAARSAGNRRCRIYLEWHAPRCRSGVAWHAPPAPPSNGLRRGRRGLERSRI